MSSKFKPGDLIILNEYGLFISIDKRKEVGIVVSESYSVLPQVESEFDGFYIVYDILLCGELCTMVPEEFMEFYDKCKKNSN